MKTKEIEQLLGKEFCKDYKIDTNAEYEIEFVKARNLITSKRIDLIAKMKYVMSKDINYDGSFFSDLYDAHIDAYTCGTFVEKTQKETKNTKQAYIDTFNFLIENIKRNGIDPNKSIIPVGKDNGIMDGAHRVSIAAYYDLDVPIVRFNNLDANDDAFFFEKRLLKESYLNYLINEYCDLKENIYTACLWPIANQKENLHHLVDEKFMSCSKIVYKKKINMNIHMLRNFMIQVYSGFDWLGALDSHFFGASTYAEKVNDESGYLTLYILEGASLDKIKDVKNEIRELYGYGNSTMHISDTHEEAMSIIQMLLNDNSLHCLKYAEPDKYKKFNIDIENLKKEIKLNNISINDFVLDSGSILALYGLRETNDIDYISKNSFSFTNPKIQMHDESEYYYNVSKYDLLNNPENYLYYYGLKFVCISRLIEMKKKRYDKTNSSKDKEDIYLLNTLNNNKSLLFKKIIYWIKRQIRNIKYIIITMIINSIFYKPLRYIYYKIKK